ncbi:hypothetical protein GCM10012275_63400 [Longimycelium tulufanense]|uniref:Uncharacterized protein n=1 Tax=Longimycelium tulufanense TaxID=907463 RepID=A0A8J3CKS9_9PSEU|nr:hypothetical protein [Longimycelium tulufanense]GGM84065.1 hypothetical protein GCM10012275_63400 [Longimycelium tulufanense]
MQCSLRGVPGQEPSEPRLLAFFGCLYFAGPRPEEAVHLTEAHLVLAWEKWNPDVPWWLAPEDAWGEIHAEGSSPSPESAWSYTGRRRDDRPLKGREIGDICPVPCPPEQSYLFCEHIIRFGAGPDGRLLRGIRGGELSESTYCHLWDRVRRAVLTTQRQSTGRG